MSEQHRAQQSWEVLGRRPTYALDASDGQSVVPRRIIGFFLRCPQGHEQIATTNFGEEVLRRLGEDTVPLTCVECDQTYQFAVGPWPDRFPPFE